MRKVMDRYLTEPDERRLFAAVKLMAGEEDQGQMLAKRDLHWMRLLRTTGIRAATLAGLTCGQARAAVRSRYLVLPGEICKRGAGYRLFLAVQARSALLGLLAIRKALGHAEHHDAPLIMSRNGQGISVRSLQARMRHWVDLAGLDCRASPHWWRHTLAKRIMTNSTAADPRGIVQASLGHKSIASTSVYTLPDREDIEAALEEANR